MNTIKEHTKEQPKAIEDNVWDEVERILWNPDQSTGNKVAMLKAKYSLIKKQSILSIEQVAEKYAEHQLKGISDKVSKFECINDFIAGANEMLPIIKELGEALIKANLYVPPKFYGQGESVVNDHYLEIQTTLDKYQNYL